MNFFGRLNKNIGDFQRYRAFTLSEVLITLGVIGIIAAMTIPTLSNHIKEQVLLTQFKKVYAELSQAYLMSAQEYGTADTWVDQSATYNNLKPYLKIIEYCPMTNGCFQNVIYKKLDSSNWSNSFYSALWFKFRLNDGCSVAVSNSSNTNLWVDINGNSPPNQFGIDVFEFQLATQNGAPFLSWGTVQTDLAHCTKDSSIDDSGRSCTYWVLKHGNMDYLHRDISAAEWVK